MRKSAIVNLNSSKFVNTLRLNYLIIIFSVVYILGIFLGTFLVSKNSAVATAAATTFSGHLEVRQSAGFFRIFLNSFLDLLPVALAVYLCGTSLVGVALIPLVIAFKGVSLGVLSGYLYSAYLLKGIAFNALLLIPTNLIAAIALIICGRISYNFSLVLIRASIPRGQAVNLYNHFQNYCKSFLISLTLFSFSALLDALMSIGFMKLFTF